MSVERFESPTVPVEVSVDEGMIRVRLRNGLELVTAVSRFPRLVHATAEQRNVWRIVGSGDGIHWPEIDEDISVRGLLTEARVASSHGG